MPGPVVQPLLTLDLGRATGQVRVVPFAPAPGRRGILVIHSGDAEIDPSPEMFFLPRSTLLITAFDDGGRRLWRHDCGPGVVPGVWFCPVLPFDLDASRAYATLMARARSEGKPIGRADGYIAATAVALGYDVATRDVRSFPKIEGLRVRRW